MTKAWIAITRVALLASLALLPLGGCGKKAQKLDDPREGLAAGWTHFRLGEYRDAVAAFEAVVARTSQDDSLHLQALYGLATTWNLRRPDEDPDRAGKLYRQILDLAPKSDLAAWSLLALARTKHLVPAGQEPKYDEVREAYQEVIDRYPGHLAAEEAFLYQQSTIVANLDEADLRKALATLGEYLTAHPDTRFKSPIHSLIADCCAGLDMPEERLQALLRSLETMETDPTNPYADKSRTYWQIATVAEFEAGDFEVARAHYRKLMKEYPKDMRNFAAKKALARMDEMERKLRAERKPPAEGGGR